MILPCAARVIYPVSIITCDTTCQEKRVRETKSNMRLHKIKQTNLVRRRQIPEHPHVRHIVDDLLRHLCALPEVVP